MTNREKFEKEILDVVCAGSNFAVDKETNKIVACKDIKCNNCLFYDNRDCHSEVIKNWCESEYVEPPVDWSKVPVDTPIFVKEYYNGRWVKRYFAKYEDGKIYAWDNGSTSWSADNDSNRCNNWAYAKLLDDPCVPISKQTPIKPTEIYNDKAESIWCTCGTCGTPLGWKGTINFNYCSECGQKIDLSDEEQGDKDEI